MCTYSLTFYLSGLLAYVLPPSLRKCSCPLLWDLFVSLYNPSLINQWDVVGMAYRAREAFSKHLQRTTYYLSLSYTVFLFLSSRRSVALIIWQGIYEFNVAFGAWSSKFDCSFF
jgi:hypothetical protein